MVIFLKKLFSRAPSEKRKTDRKSVEYGVACRPERIIYKEHNGLLASDEILTKTFNISKTGVCLHWPTYFKCHFCKNRIDTRNNHICGVKTCEFSMNDLEIGQDMFLALQIDGEVIENIRAKIVWHEEAEASFIKHGKLGLRFYEEMELG